MLAESKWAGTALGWAGLCLCAVFLLSHVFGFCFMMAMCFKSVSPSVKQKDIPEAISIGAFISCAYSISGRRITFLGSSEPSSFQACEFMPQNGHSEGSYHLVCFCPKYTRSDFRPVSSGWNLTMGCPERPGFEAWHHWKVAEYPSSGCSKFSRDNSQIQNQWGCFVIRSPFYFSSRYLEFLFLWLCYFPVY